MFGSFLSNNNTLCSVPFNRVFVLNDGSFRDCCATRPPIISNDTFNQWWNNNPDLSSFRDQLKKNTWSDRCSACQIQEKTQGTSFRTEVNNFAQGSTNWPNQWSIMFGTRCNLACWVCSENSSSVIENHKRRLGLLDANFESPNSKFESRWPDIKSAILDSYQYNQTVYLHLLGGEPVYNTIAISFLEELVAKGLSKRTRLEITTNATIIKPIRSIIKKSIWNHISVYLSLDAVGRKAEWLRYGTDWQKIDRNVDFYRVAANYVQIHATVSVLNLNDLPDMQNYAESKKLNINYNPVVTPQFMNLKHWDGPQIYKDITLFQNTTLKQYVELTASEPIKGSHQQLLQYIKSFDSIRQPLSLYDSFLSNVLAVD